MDQTALDEHLRCIQDLEIFTRTTKRNGNETIHVMVRYYKPMLCATHAPYRVMIDASGATELEVAANIKTQLADKLKDDIEVLQSRLRQLCDLSPGAPTVGLELEDPPFSDGDDDPRANNETLRHI